MRLPQGRSLHDEVGVFGVLADVFADEWTDDIDLVAFFASPVQSAFRERRSHSHAAQLFGNFGVDELKDVPAETVFKIRDLAVALDFDAPTDYSL
jgi:hypothetical protein